MNLSIPSYALSEKMWNNAICCVTYCLTTLAGMSIGQLFLRFLDRCLWITEKSSQWSLPYHELVQEVDGKSFKSMELVRPLPWLLFLPVLLILRSFRLIWNVGSAIFGYAKIEPSDIVKHVQMARRRLRNIKINGVKSLRQKRAANTRPVLQETSLHVAKRSLLQSIQLTLSSLSCLDLSKLSPSPSPTRIQISVNNQVSLTPDEKSATESTIAYLTSGDSKRKYTEINSDEHESDESENETLNAKIDRFAQENSSDDPDFDPGVYNSETSTSNCTDGEEEENEGGNLSVKEIQNLLNNSEADAGSEVDVQSDTGDNIQNDSTCDDSNGKNRDIVECVGEQQDYHSPHEYKSGDDGEAEFYSPISSKSTTPERVLSNFNEGRTDEGEWKGKKLMEKESSGVIVHDEISEKTNGHAETSALEKACNRNKYISKTQPKTHQPKGKRVIHGNRKKK